MSAEGIPRRRFQARLLTGLVPTPAGVERPTPCAPGDEHRARVDAHAARVAAVLEAQRASRRCPCGGRRCWVRKLGAMRCRSCGSKVPAPADLW